MGILRKHLFILFVLVSAIGAANVEALDSCHAIFQARENALPGLRIRIDFTDSLVEIRPAIREMMQKAESLLGELQIEEIRVFADDSTIFYRSNFDPLQNKINLGLVSGDGKNSINGPVFMHEFGHALFNQRFHFIHQGHDVSFQQLRVKIKAKLSESTSSDPMNTQQIDFLQQQVAALSRMAMPYNEMFADLWSALFHKNGSAMADALRYAEQKPYYFEIESRDKPPLSRRQNPMGARPRDFTQTSNFKDWKLEGEENSNINSYTLFDPFRGAAWALVKNKISPDTPPKKILTAFLNASAAHFSQRIARGENLYFQENPTLLNQELLKYFVAELRAEHLLNK